MDLYNLADDKVQLVNDDSNEEKKKDNLLENFDRLKEELEEKNNIIVEDKVNDENSQLINNDSDEEKKNLIKIFDKLKEELEKKNNINDAYNLLFQNEVDLNNEIKFKNRIKFYKLWYLRIMFYVISPIIATINLIGIFQIISIQKSVLTLFTSSFLCYFSSSKHEEIKKDYVKAIPFDFFHFVYEESKKESIDFNLMMLTNFIGNMLLKSCGFTASSIVLFIINMISFFILIIFSYNDYTDEEKLQYNIFKVIVLLICFLVIFTGIGASALLFQTILIDSFSQYKLLKPYFIDKKSSDSNKSRSQLNILENDESIEPMNEMQSINSDSYKESQKSKTFNINNIDLIKKKIEKKRKRREKNEKNKFDFFFFICLTTIFGNYGKYILNNSLDKLLSKFRFINNDNKKYKYFFYSIYTTYFISILFSIAFYYFFIKSFTNDEKEDKKGNKLQICKFCGYIVYSKTTNLDKKEHKCGCLNCILEFFKLSGKSTAYCCDKLVYNICNEDDDADEIQCICCKCCNYDKNEYNKKTEFFCYCYQEESKFNWCKNFFTNKTQKTIVPFIIEYCIMKLYTIAFQKNYKDISKNVESKLKILSITFPSTFFLFFYLTLTFSKIIQKIIDKKQKDKDNAGEIKEKDNNLKDENNNLINENNDLKDKVQKRKRKNIFKLIFKLFLRKFSNEILNGTHAIFFFNGIASFIISTFNFSKLSETKLYKDIFKENSYIVIPILLNQFYYFTLNYYCIRIWEEEKGFELVPVSTLISLYILIMDLIVKFIIYISNDSFLFGIQIMFSVVPLFLFFVFFFNFIFYIICTIHCFPRFFYFFLLFFGGGICYDPYYCLEGCYFFKRKFYCEFCCCDLDNPCFCEYCSNNCYEYQKLCCCDCYNFFRCCRARKCCKDYSIDEINI